MLKWINRTSRCIIRINSKPDVIGHDRIINYRNLSEWQDESPPITTTIEPEHSTDAEGNIGAVYDGPERVPTAPALPSEQNWSGTWPRNELSQIAVLISGTDFISQGLEFARNMNQFYLYTKKGENQLCDVHATSPPRKCDIFSALVQHSKPPKVYAGGHYCTYSGGNAVIVAITVARSSSVLKLALYDTDTGNIVFRAPSSVTVTKHNFDIDNDALASWNKHLADAPLVAKSASEKRAQTKRPPVTRSQKTISLDDDSSESSSEEQLITKRKRQEVTVTPRKRQRVVSTRPSDTEQHFSINPRESQALPPQPSAPNVSHSLDLSTVATVTDIVLLKGALKSLQDQLLAVQAEKDAHDLTIKAQAKQLLVLSADIASLQGEVSMLKSKVLQPVLPTEKVVYIPSAPHPVETRYIRMPEYFNPEPQALRTPTRYSYQYN